MIRNTEGQIAMKWVINPNGKTVKIDGTDQFYVFTPNYHVVMAWINPEHVSRLLSVKEKSCNCNNGTFKNAFALAHLLDVNLWMTGDRHAENHEVTWEEVSDGT